MEPGNTFDELPVPTMLRRARGTYSLAIRTRLRAEGLSDLPRNGPFVVGGLANGLSAEQLLHDLNLSDAQSERLLGALLEAHFVEAEHDSEASDTLALRNTAKGLRAARAVAEAIANVNHELSHLLTPEELLGFRKALVALTGVEMRFDESPHSSRPV